MDEKIINNIKEFLSKTDKTIKNIETFYNLEGDYVMSYVQNGQKKIISIMYVN